MDLIFMGFLVVMAGIYMFMSIHKRKKGSFILGAVCFIIFAIITFLVYLAKYSTF